MISRPPRYVRKSACVSVCLFVWLAVRLVVSPLSLYIFLSWSLSLCLSTYLVFSLTSFLT